jgi:8-oxo-dGTP pyrophosphatase MutT (NUDIX family)
MAAEPREDARGMQRRPWYARGMPISDYLKGLRARVGHDLLVVPAATAAVRDDAGRLLLVRHTNRNVWVAPGGSMDPDETPADAVVRETWEETGLEVLPTRLVGVYSGPDFRVHYENGDLVTYVMVVIACRVLGGTPRPDGVETLEVGWFAEREIARLATPPWVGVVLPEVFAPSGARGFSPPTWRPPGDA